MNLNNRSQPMSEKKYVNIGAAWKRSFTSKRTGEQETILSATTTGKNVPVKLWVQFEDGTPPVQLKSFVISKNKKKKEDNHPDYYMSFDLNGQDNNQ